MLRVKSEYGSGDVNFGVMDYSFDGTSAGPNAEVNLNLGATASTTNPLGGYNFPARAVDGQIVSRDPSNATFWVRDASAPDSLTVNYTSPQNVGFIGLGFAGDTNSRDLPKYVTLTASNGQSQIVTIDPLQSQYQRYRLITGINNTTSLRVTFPTDISSASW